MPERGEELLRSRQDKLDQLRDKGIDPYPARYRRTYTAEDAVSLFIDHEAEYEDGHSDQTVSVAGRIMSMRIMGKAAFLDLRDASGKIQAHFRRDVLEDEFPLVRDLDIGDFLGVSGPLFRTRTGEVTVEVREMKVLSKSMRPLPEKWHGLRDVEVRYRQRHLDLIANPEVKTVFIQRNKIINGIRSFLDARGFIEVDTPVLVPIPAGALARPFVTHHHVLDEELYLRIATELYLKRLIVGGFDKVYEIGRVFRNEGMDQDHNPEFTLLESYEAYADYDDVMNMVEEMVFTVASSALGSPKTVYREMEIDFTPPWRRVSFCDAVKSHSGLDIDPYVRGHRPIEELSAAAGGMGIDLRNVPPFKVYDKIFSATVEPNLIQPVFVMDYPKVMSPLAKEKRDDPALVERFEGFAGGMELANAYSELNDPHEQADRFAEQEQLREQFQEEETDRTDMDFLEALEHGMPPTGGLGVGIDRLVMLLTGQNTLRDALLFPQMRSKK